MRFPFVHRILRGLVAKEFSLSLDRGPEFGPALDERCRGDAPEFARLDLIQSSAVHTTLAAQLVAADSAEKFMHVGGAAGVLSEHGREAVQRVEHQIEIRSDGLRSVEDEAERLLVVRAAAHVCAKEGGAGTLLLLYHGLRLLTR